MCLFNSLKLELKQEDENIVNLYHKSTGINCTVFYLDDKQTIASIFESLDYNECSLCPSVKSLDNISLEKILKIFDSEGKPYVFFGHCLYAFITVGVWSENNHRKIFFAGPIRTKENSPKCSFNFVHLDLPKLPVLDSFHIKIASQLLYDLVKFNIYINPLYASAEIEHSNDQWDNIKTLHSMDESIFYEIYNANSIGKNKKRIVKSLGYMNDRIESILKLVASNQLFLAKKVSEELILPIVYENDLIQARSYFIGIASLLGQKVAESYNFIYTPEMFFIYSEYIENMSNAKDKFSVYSFTVIYFNNIFQEMVNVYGDNKIDTPALKTVTYIQKNYKTDLRINTIAHVLNFDSSYLCRAFKVEMGFTIKNYITTYRLTKAADLILETKKSISTIAQDVGYQDAKLFVKHFKNQYGIAPSIYRQSLIDKYEK